MARPSDFTPEIAADICGRLAGGEPLSTICKSEEMPGLSTVYRWLQSDESFREQYARAREDQADTLADEIVRIADETPPLVAVGQEGATLVVDGSAIQWQKLRVEARKWTASKMKPKKYGDRVTQEVTGADGGPLRHSVSVSFVGPAS